MTSEPPRDPTPPPSVASPSAAQLQARLADIAASPRERGVVQALFARPAVGERRALAVAELDSVVGLVGDNWSTRGSRRTADGSPHPEQQLTLMNGRALAAIAGTPDRFALAGDQLIVDFELSVANVPPGTRLAIGTAVIEVTALPHTGCAKFAARFGAEALAFVNSPEGRALQLRGINARVVEPGHVRPGDAIGKLPAAAPPALGRPEPPAGATPSP